MNKRALLSCAVVLSGMLVAQQPAPMGKANDSGKNYRSPDGTLLSKHSSDDELARALNEGYSNDPEFGNVQVAVKHHRVTLAGSVVTKDAKARAEKMALHTAGVNDVRNRLKIADLRSKNDATMSTTAH